MIESINGVLWGAVLVFILFFGCCAFSEEWLKRHKNRICLFVISIFILGVLSMIITFPHSLVNNLKDQIAQQNRSLNQLSVKMKDFETELSETNSRLINMRHYSKIFGERLDIIAGVSYRLRSVLYYTLQKKDHKEKDRKILSEYLLKGENYLDNNTE